jgi:transposase
MIEGIIYRYRTGIAWRDLPETFGKWQTVWTWHRRLAADGSWDAIHQALTAHAAKNDKVDFTVSVDSTIARAHQHATNISRVKKGLVELQGSADRPSGRTPRCSGVNCSKG